MSQPLESATNMDKHIPVIASIIAFAAYSFTAAAQQSRANIYVDEDLYSDADVLAAVQKYANAVEKRHDIKIDIKAFPAAFVLNDQLQFEEKATAQELKADIQKSWADSANGRLVGAILIGNLPIAQMELYIRESDGKPTQGMDDVIMRYQIWNADLYFMDMDGAWKDVITGTDCKHESPCTSIASGSNGIIDTHYSKNGVVGTDDFEIWVSRVNPYGEPRDQYTYDTWMDQLRNYDTEYFPQVKKFVLNWLEKSYKQQAKTEPYSDRGQFSYSSHSTLTETDPVMFYIKGIANNFNRTDIVAQSTKEEYLEGLTLDYDWSFFAGHGSPKSINNGVSIFDFDSPIEVKPRMIHLDACSAMRNFNTDDKFYDRSLGNAYLFRTLNGGTTVIGYTKTSGGFQDDSTLYNNMKEHYLGDAFRNWVNHRTLVFDNSKYPQEVYDWFYAVSLIGDPFIRLNSDKDNVKPNAVPENIALHAMRKMVLDGKCYDRSQGDSAKCNVVNDMLSPQNNYSTIVRGTAEIGNIYTRDGIKMSDNISVQTVNIYNDFSKAKFYTYETAQYKTITYWNPKFWNENTEWNEDLENFDTKDCPNLTTPKTSRLSDGGCYKKITIASKDTLIIPPGEFFIDTLDLQPGAICKFENSEKPSVMHVKQDFYWEGKISDVNDTLTENIAKNFRVYQHQGKASQILAPFYGSLLAKASAITIDSDVYGTVSGLDIFLSDEAKVYYVKPNTPKAETPDDDPDSTTTILTTAAKHLHNAGIRITALHRDAIAFDAPVAGRYKITIMNVVGNIIASTEMECRAGSNITKWNTGSVASGHYLVNITSKQASKNRIFFLK